MLKKNYAKLLIISLSLTLLFLLYWLLSNHPLPLKKVNQQDIELVYRAFFEFNADAQEKQLKEALVLKPDLLITLIIAPLMATLALAHAQSAITIITLISNLPANFKRPPQYAGIVKSVKTYQYAK